MTIVLLSARLYLHMNVRYLPLLPIMHHNRVSSGSDHLFQKYMLVSITRPLQRVRLSRAEVLCISSFSYPFSLSIYKPSYPYHTFSILFLVGTNRFRYVCCRPSIL